MTETAPTRAAAPPVRTEPLRVLAVHNRYQIRGGEDRVYEDEAAILEARGHAVERFEVTNDDVDGMGRAGLAMRTVWSADSRRAVGAAVRAHRADIVHVHNTLPLVSPSAYYGARAGGAAVVQTLHNYRISCPGALLARDGAPCEDCLGKAFASAGVRHGCYRGSRAATLAVATMTAAHRALGTWRSAVDRYICSTAFARDKMIQGGLPADRVVVKPNPLATDPGVGQGGGGFALFVGRLDPARGIATLLRAWAFDPSLPPLVIVGGGPLDADVQAGAGADDRITALGHQPYERVVELMQAADALVFPSTVYEGGNPMALVEAFACGLPVVASRLGGPATMVTPEAGRLAAPGDAAALGAAVHDLLAADRPAARRAARTLFDSTYAPDANHDRLVRIYQQALAQRHAG